MAIPVTKEGAKSKVRTAEVQLMKADDVSSCGLGAQVKITLIGEVTELKGIEEYTYSKSDSSVYPGRIKLEVDSVTFQKIGEFDGMESDEDEG